MRQANVSVDTTARRTGGLQPNALPAQGVLPEPAPVGETSPGRRPEPVAPATSPRSPTPLFLPEEDPTEPNPSEGDSGNPPLRTESAPPPRQSSPAPGLAMTDDELREWSRQKWADGVTLLRSFQKRSWGTAYWTVAEIRVLIQIGQMYRMTVNTAVRSVSAGSYVDRDGGEKPITLPVLGSYLNGQSPGTWTNKLTFFFHVHRFLAATNGTAGEDLPGDLHGIRQSMTSWGVYPEILKADNFLPRGDARAAYVLKRAREELRRYNT